MIIVIVIHGGSLYSEGNRLNGTASYNFVQNQQTPNLVQSSPIGQPGTTAWSNVSPAQHFLQRH